MLCILSFIIFLILFPILGFFPEYRKYFRKSWECVFKKITLKPCDINLGEELKNKFIGKIFLLSPRFARFVDKTFSFWAFVFVVINIWSVGYMAIAGLNLWVYDTCTPKYAEGCSLTGDTCSISTKDMTFEEALTSGKVNEWFSQPFVELADTVSRVPERFKNWQSEEYLPVKPTYYSEGENKKIALEVIDPSCQFCKLLFRNIKSSSFTSRYSLTYIAYPIEDKSKPNGYRFPHSLLVSKYLEATKYFQPKNPKSKISGDWQLLDKIFTEKYNGQDFQDLFNFVYSDKPEEVEKILQSVLFDLGYSQDQVNQIKDKSRGIEIEKNLKQNKEIVDKRIRTVKIPTTIFNGRRYDRLLDTEYLNNN